MESIKFVIRSIIFFFLLLIKTSYATNVGFESGNLSGWTVGGNDVIISTGVNNVTFGDNKYWTINPYGEYMAQLYPSGSITFDNAVESLGLNSTENTAIRSFMSANAGGGSPNPTNATWIRRTVTLQAGVTYSFAWNYLSTDYTPFNDGSMMTLVHATNSNIIPTLNNNQQRYALLGFTNLGTGNYSTGSYGSTGWQLAVFTVPENGDYVFGFATFNLGDTILSPMLFIDELQGETYLNSQPFAPIAPNPGSNAPVTGGDSSPSLCCGGSSAAFTADAVFVNRLSSFSVSNIDNRVVIQQIGNNSTISVTQSGRKNYAEIQSTGSNNSVDINQTTTGINPTNYLETTINGGNNSINLSQHSTGGSLAISAIVNNENNTLTINQSGSGHYAEIVLSGGNKTVNLSQTGSGEHMAKIELSGGSTEIIAVQSGSVQQFYSISHSCAQTSCAAITVTQGQ
jgi:fibronectin-binding autotransporter adhesin